MLIEKAFLQLYPERKLGDYSFSLQYSDKFHPYNANVKKRGRDVHFFLSRKWETINEDVQIGLIQSLMNKLFATRDRTNNIDMYDFFLKKVHIAIPKTKTDAILVESFNRVNEKYFFSMMEMPNLQWGTDSFHKLGHYEYGSDTITISTLFKSSETELLDYLMFHELLHKKHKWKRTGNRSRHHTREFFADEERFEDYGSMEKKLHSYLRKSRLLSFFGTK
jgi:hypothetical protein